MNPWTSNPVWQNFSSLIREATMSLEAKPEMERSHHLTSALYFSIAALEAFLNRHMRAYLSKTKTEGEIVSVLRKGQIIGKLKDWPVELLGKPLALNKGTLDLLILVNDVRGELTHPKTHGQDIYKRLEGVDPRSVVDSVAEYIVRFHETQKTRYPYWLFGWNYLNLALIAARLRSFRTTSFVFSLQALGFMVPASAYFKAEAWRNRFMGSMEGFETIKRSLAAIGHCSAARWSVSICPASLSALVDTRASEELRSSPSRECGTKLSSRAE